jgi:hypothetical protein
MIFFLKIFETIGKVWIFIRILGCSVSISAMFYFDCSNIQWRPTFKISKPNICRHCREMLCRWRGVARGSGGHLLNLPNQIYAAHCCAGGVALQEVVAAIFFLIL